MAERRHRRVVDRGHRDRYRRCIATEVPVADRVAEAVDAVEVGIRRVGKRAVRRHRRRAVERAGVRRHRQRVTIGVAIRRAIDEDVAADGDVFCGRVSIGCRHRCVVDRGYRYGNSRGCRSDPVAHRVGEAVGPVEVGGRGVSEDPGRRHRQCSRKRIGIRRDRQRIAINITVGRSVGQDVAADRDIFVGRVGVSGRHRRVVDRGHRKGDRCCRRGEPIAHSVGEAVRSIEIGIGRVGERTSRRHRHHAGKRCGVRRDRQRVAIGIAVGRTVGQDIAAQHHVFAGRVCVGGCHRQRVHGERLHGRAGLTAGVGHRQRYCIGSPGRIIMLRKLDHRGSAVAEIPRPAGNRAFGIGRNIHETATQTAAIVGKTRDRRIIFDIDDDIFADLGGSTIAVGNG